MLGGNHFKKKLQKKARKKEAKKAQKVDTAGGGKAPPVNNSKFKSGSNLKGPVVSYDFSAHQPPAPAQQQNLYGASNRSYGAGRHTPTAPSRDSGNEKRNVPFATKQDEQMHKVNTRARTNFNTNAAAASVQEYNRSASASSAAQRRRVLKHKKDDDLLDHFREKLNASTFRLLNEQIYNSPTAFAGTLLKDDATFREYHTGYRQQLVQWPVNPNRLVIDALLGDKRGRFLAGKGKNMPGHIPPNWVIADMGCGDAQIAAALQPKGYKAHSFDFCALNELVTVANSSKVPLPDNSIDVCIFSLSLMATDYELSLFEAFRILKPNRLLKIVEVRSRIPFPRKFAELVESMGFTSEYEDLAGDYFVAFDFLKLEKRAAPNRNLPHSPGDVLMPSLYKKR